MTERDLTGLRGGDRGQTTQDFAVGISVFLLTVTFTFAFVPSTVTPFGSPVTDAIPAKSDRVASTVVDTYAVEDGSRTLDFDELTDPSASPTSMSNAIGSADVSDTVSGDNLRDMFGLRDTAQVNITIEKRSGDIVKAEYDSSSAGKEAMVGGDDYPQNQAAASTTRVIRLEGVDGCKTGCLLVVRVW
jgi:hypothetical protein